MGTATGSNSDSPLRGGRLWSHNTSYTAVAGVHSEVGKKADVLQLNSQRKLSTSLSTMQTIHQKELRTLQHHRKSLESSMMAYSQKMRKISSDRLQLAKVPGRAGGEEEKGVEGGSFNRLLMTSTLPATRSRVSMSTDSGVGLTQPRSEVTRRSSNSKNLLVTSSSLTDMASKSTPMSFHFTNEINSPKTSTTLSRDNGESSSSPDAPRRRRTGTMEQPDVFALHLNMRKSWSKDDQSKDQQPPSSSNGSASPPVTILPFPDSSSSSAISTARSGILIALDEDFDRISGTSSRTSQASTKKLMLKTKENYWSYRNKSPHRLSLPLTLAHAAKKKNSTSSEPPRPSPRARPKPIHRNRITPRRSNKTYHSSFRYSLAVEDALQSLDDTASSAINRRIIRKVSETLPALDLHDLRVQRQQRQDTHRSDKGVASEFPPSNMSIQQEHNNEDIHKDDSRNEEVDDNNVDDEAADADSEEKRFQELGVSRERSMSAPDVLHPENQDRVLEERVEEILCVSEEPGGQGYVSRENFEQNFASSDNSHLSTAPSPPDQGSEQ